MAIEAHLAVAVNKPAKILAMFLLIGCLSGLLAQNEAAIVQRSQFSIGETIEIHSAVLDEKRVLNVYLPNSYTYDSTRVYPVIYLLDGSVDEDFIHIAGLVQFGSFSWINMLPETIVVGIANVDRRRDFTYPSKNMEEQKDFPTAGGAAKFMAFLEKELQPLISENYRIGANRTLIGQSLGGLLATQVLFRKPALFDHYIIISPSLWWDDESLLATKLKALPAGKFVYVGVGKEGEIMERLAKALFEKLKSGNSVNTGIHFGFFEELSHGDALHLAVYDAFNKLFRKKKD